MPIDKIQFVRWYTGAAIFVWGLVLLSPSGANGQSTVTELIASGSVWKYDATGTDLGTGWRAPSFDDGIWPSGPGILGFGETYITTTVPFGPDPSNKYRTTYFRLAFTVDFDPSLITQLQLLANHDDGAVIYLNGTEVARPAMPAGPISYSTFATSHESGNYDLNEISGHIGLLLPGPNVLAVEVHQTSASSSDLAWDARLIADTSQIQFLWSGGVTESSARVKARLLSEGIVARLLVDTDPLFSAPVLSSPDTALAADNNRVVDLTVAGLNPSTQYYYALELDGSVKTEKTGRFRTFPTAAVCITLFLLTGDILFENAALCCCAMGTLAAPVVYGSGLLDWSVRFKARRAKLFMRKRSVGVALVIVSALMITARLYLGAEFVTIGVEKYVYAGAIYILTGMATYLGYLGGKFIV